MKLFVGLGNPGGKYAGNRHNVGFMAVERIAAAHGFSPWRKRFQGETADGLIDNEKVLLLKPGTYMNDSGRAVGEAVSFHKLSINDVIVFYDEIDLAPGKLKVKSGGGNAGHNGLRSITHLVGNDYMRVRIGIGHPGHKDLVANYVLHDFAKADAEWLLPLLDAIADNCGHLAKDDAPRFLSDVATKLNPKDAKASEAKPRGGKSTKSDDGDAASGTADPNASPPPTKKPGRHPAGGRMSQQKSALAENLKKWLKGREDKD